jgi:hypothetical protein
MHTIKTVGKAKIQMQVAGCIDCGTEHSSGWTVAKVIEVKVGTQSFQAQIYRCADCLKKNAKVAMF